LELIIVLALVACGYLVYLWITFANFRAELMNEFGRRGLSYSAANALFSFWSREISDMRHNKVSTAQIVDLVMQNVDIKENGNLINSDRSSGRVEYSTENLKLSVALDFLHRLKQVDDHMVGAVLAATYHEFKDLRQLSPDSEKWFAELNSEHEKYLRKLESALLARIHLLQRKGAMFEVPHLMVMLFTIQGIIYSALTEVAQQIWNNLTSRGVPNLEQGIKAARSQYNMLFSGNDLLLIDSFHSPALRQRYQKIEDENRSTRNEFLYDTYADYSEAFTRKCNAINPEKASFLTFLDDSPLKLAYDQRVDPIQLAIDWTSDFDIQNLMANIVKKGNLKT
jgi:hypothetical protein